MLAATHVAVGAAVALPCRSRRAAVLAGLASHAVIDGIGHDDDTVSAVGQAALSVLALVAVAAVPRPRVMAGALAGFLPDVEVALWLLRGEPAGAHLLFPSHWPRRGRTGHPYRFPGPSVPVRLELMLSSALLAGVVLSGRRRSSG